MAAKRIEVGAAVWLRTVGRSGARYGIVWIPARVVEGPRERNVWRVEFALFVDNPPVTRWVPARELRLREASYV